MVAREAPPGLRLRATVDIDDPNAVMDLVIDKLYEFQVEQELPVSAVPAQPAARIAEALRSHPVRRAPRNGRTILHP